MIALLSLLVTFHANSEGELDGLFPFTPVAFVGVDDLESLAGSWERSPWSRFTRDYGADRWPEHLDPSSMARCPDTVARWATGETNDLAMSLEHRAVLVDGLTQIGRCSVGAVGVGMIRAKLGDVGRLLPYYVRRSARHPPPAALIRSADLIAGAVMEVRGGGPALRTVWNSMAQARGHAVGPIAQLGQQAGPLDGGTWLSATHGDWSIGVSLRGGDHPTADITLINGVTTVARANAGLIDDVVYLLAGLGECDLSSYERRMITSIEQWSHDPTDKHGTVSIVAQPSQTWDMPPDAHPALFILAARAAGSGGQVGLLRDFIPVIRAFGPDLVRLADWASTHLASPVRATLSFRPTGVHIDFQQRFGAHTSWARRQADLFDAGSRRLVPPIAPGLGLIERRRMNPTGLIGTAWSLLATMENPEAYLDAYLPALRLLLSFRPVHDATESVRNVARDLDEELRGLAPDLAAALGGEFAIIHRHDTTAAGLVVPLEDQAAARRVIARVLTLTGLQAHPVTHAGVPLRSDPGRRLSWTISDGCLVIATDPSFTVKTIQALDFEGHENPLVADGDFTWSMRGPAFSLLEAEIEAFPQQAQGMAGPGFAGAAATLLRLAPLFDHFGLGSPGVRLRDVDRDLLVRHFGDRPCAWYGYVRPDRMRVVFVGP